MLLNIRLCEKGKTLSQQCVCFLVSSVTFQVRRETVSNQDNAGIITTDMQGAILPLLPRLIVWRTDAIKININVTVSSCPVPGDARTRISYGGDLLTLCQFQFLKIRNPIYTYTRMLLYANAWPVFYILIYCARAAGDIRPYRKQFAIGKPAEASEVQWNLD